MTRGFLMFAMVNFGFERRLRNDEIVSEADTALSRVFEGVFISLHFLGSRTTHWGARELLIRLFIIGEILW